MTVNPSIDDLTAQKCGYLGWNYAPYLARNAIAMVANTGYFTARFVPAGTVIKSLVTMFAVLPVGTNPTSTRLGIIDLTTGVPLARTADIATAAKAATVKTPTAFALESPLPIGRDTGIMIGWWMEGSFGTTQPSLYQNSSDNDGAAVSGGYPSFSNVNATGLDLVVGTAVTRLQTASIAPWFAWL